MVQGRPVDVYLDMVSGGFSDKKPFAKDKIGKEVSNFYSGKKLDSIVAAMEGCKSYNPDDLRFLRALWKGRIDQDGDVVATVEGTGSFVVPDAVSCLRTSDGVQKPKSGHNRGGLLKARGIGDYPKKATSKKKGGKKKEGKNK